MPEKNHNHCNRVPETSRCEKLKQKDKCPAKAIGKVCISPNANKKISINRAIPSRYAGINVIA